VTMPSIENAVARTQSRRESCSHHHCNRESIGHRDQEDRCIMPERIRLGDSEARCRGR
jgi:hypothetical protein